MRDASVAQVGGAPAEVKGVHPHLVKDLAKLGIGNAHRRPEGQGDDAQPKKDLLGIRNLPAQGLGAFAHDKIVVVVGVVADGVALG